MLLIRTATMPALYLPLAALLLLSLLNPAQAGRRRADDQATAILMIMLEGRSSYFVRSIDGMPAGRFIRHPRRRSQRRASLRDKLGTYALAPGYHTIDVMSQGQALANAAFAGATGAATGGASGGRITVTVNPDSSSGLEINIPGPGTYLLLINSRHGRTHHCLDPRDEAASESFRLAKHTSAPVPTDLDGIRDAFDANRPVAITGMCSGRSQEAAGEEPEEPGHGFLDTDSEGLAQGLEDPDWQVRKRTALELAEVADEHSIDALIGALRDPHKYVRGAAARSLGEIGALHAAPSLISALGDPALHVRASAAEALGLLRDESAIGPLRELLKDRSKAVRQAAREALDRLEG